jgi:hypothetical protein
VVLLVIVTLVAAALCVIRLPGARTPTKLGWMSDQWLAEYRASQGS